MIEQDVHRGYQEHSSRQITSIEARYNQAVRTAIKEPSLYGGRWLDVGPNRGFGLLRLTNIPFTVFAVDVEKNYLQEALTRNTNVKGSVMDGCHLGFQDNTFTLITLFEVIEHLEEARQNQLIQELHRVLTPDGLLILSTPNKIASGKRRMSADHVKELTNHELVSILQENGFVINQFLGQGFFKNTFSHHLFRRVRENSLIVFAYFHLLPWSIRSKIRDKTITFQRLDEVRKKEENEIEKLMYVVCSKV